MNYKICVVGGGYWGKNHIATLNEMGSLGGIVDSNNSVTKFLSKQYPDTAFYKSVNDALEDEYDGFIVATPAESHFKVARAIIKMQKPLLIEKPMTLSIKDAEDLINLAEKNKVNMMVGHVLLFHPAINKIKKVISSGAIGDLQYIYSNRLNLGKVRTEENVFWSLAPHDIAIFQYLTDSKPNVIKSIGSSFLQKDIYDSTLTHLEYENGTKGHIFVSWLHPFKEHRLVVIGSEAMISFEDSNVDKPLKLYSKKIDLVDGIPEKIDGPVESLPFENKMPLEIEINYFLKHINGKKIEKASMYHGLEVIKILVYAGKQLSK
tara:strand:- start:3743 stop:4702 length:960 start_codon:yes stop_codon:yes gene_type:complete